MSSNTVDFLLNGAVNTQLGPSASIWADCPVAELRENPAKGIYLYDQFTQGGTSTSPTAVAALVGIPYSGMGSANSTITYNVGTSAAGVGGVICTEATDNECCYLFTDTKPFRISANLGKLWFEGRVKVNAITDDQIGFIFGLFTDAIPSVVIPLSTANPPIFATTGDFIGFWGREEDAGAVRTTYVAGGVASVVVQAAVHQFVADTYVKLGMVFDPKDGNKLKFYVNGVQQTTTKTVPDNTGTDFPADTYTGMFFGHRLGAGTSSLSTLNWWRAAQLFV